MAAKEWSKPGPLVYLRHFLGRRLSLLRESQMSLELKAPLAGYFEATNAHHPDEVAALFSADGLVHDQGHDYRGSDAIRNWADDTHRKFALRLSPADVLEEGGVTMVRTQVAGAFLGSPIHQWYRFRTSANAIEELVIG